MTHDSDVKYRGRGFVLSNQKPRVVVLGAGYAGMMTTKKLTKLLRPEQAEIVLVNKHNYHYQTTWLHQVAAGTINQNQVRMMISDVIDTKHRVNLIQDSVLEIKKDEKTVVLENGELQYDILVVGLGFESATFGITGMKENAFAIQTIDSSRLIYDHIEYQFSRYKNEEGNKEELLTILVGGSGFTGIEFVGELTESVKNLCRKYDIPRYKARIINVEAAPSILPGFDEELVTYAKSSLEARGVEFRTGTMIKECKEDGFVVGEGEEIKAGTVVWTGGVQANSILGKSGFEITKGRVTVNSDLRAPGYRDIFILGDCAWVMDKENDRPYPPNAQNAMQQADTAAQNIASLIYGGAMQEYKFENKGTVASLGGSEAIGTVFDRQLFGKPAKTMKNVVDNRYLFMLGGPGLVLKKGKLSLF